MFELKVLLNKFFNLKDMEAVTSFESHNNTVKDNIIENKNIEYINIPKRPFGEQTPKYLSFCFKSIPSNKFKAYFKNGELYNVKPRNEKNPLYADRQIAYSARYIISDGIEYDLEDPESIERIKIPEFNKTNNMNNVTFDLGYILKMRAGSEYRPLLALPLVFKVANLMLASPVGWDKKDYYRLVIQLWHIGEIYYGDYLLGELNKRLPFMVDDRFYSKKNFYDAINNAKKFKCRYIIAGHSGVTCEKCAPYQDRIYSIADDSRFPNIPQFIMEQGGLHCDISFSFCNYYNGKTITKYIYKSSNDVTTKEVDAIKYSNRPFVDDRSLYEKQNYEEWKKEKDRQKEADKKYYDKNYHNNKYKLHLEYQNIVEIMREKAPKNYSSYMRMKKSNTINFQKILEIANKNGIEINN